MVCILQKWGRIIQEFNLHIFILFTLQQDLSIYCGLVLPRFMSFLFDKYSICPHWAECFYLLYSTNFRRQHGGHTQVLWSAFRMFYTTLSSYCPKWIFATIGRDIITWRHDCNKVYFADVTSFQPFNLQPMQKGNGIFKTKTGARQFSNSLPGFEITVGQRSFYGQNWGCN